jgi:TolB protein
MTILLRLLLVLCLVLTLLIMGSLAYGAAFPGDEIVYEVRSENAFTVHLMDVRAGMIRALPLRSSMLSYPQWSPDGTQLAYFVPGETTNAIYVADSAFRAPHLLLASQEVGAVSGFAWSPDGNHIAVTGANLWILSVDGSLPPESRAPIGIGDYRTIAWSPDGRRFAFSYASLLDTYKVSIFVYDLATDEVRWLAVGDDPDWSPDGTRITYVYGELVAVMDVETKTRSYIAEGFAPSWSPDGEWIAFSHTAPNRVDLMLYHLASGEQRVLLNDSRVNLFRNWRPRAVIS